MFGVCCTYVTGSIFGGGGGGGGGIVQVTVAQLVALITNNTLVPLTVYQVTDSNDDLSTGNANIVYINVTALSTDTISPTQQALYWYPDYRIGANAEIENVWLGENLRTGLGVAAYVAGDVAIFNNYRYRNLTGTNTNTAPDADAVNWVFLPQSLANGYIQFWNEVVYDPALDLILSREETIPITNIDPAIGISAFIANNKVILNAKIYYIDGINTVNFFQWGMGNGSIINGSLLNCNNCQVVFNAVVDTYSIGFLGTNINSSSIGQVEHIILQNNSNLDLQGRMDGDSGGFGLGITVLNDSEVTCFGAYAGGFSITDIVVDQASIVETFTNSGDTALLNGMTVRGNSTLRLNSSNFDLGVFNRVTLDISGGGVSNFTGCSWGQGISAAIIASILLSGSDTVDLRGSTIDGNSGLIAGQGSYAITGSPVARNMHIASGNNVSLIGGAVASYARIGKGQPQIIVVAESGQTAGNISYSVIEGLAQDGIPWIFHLAAYSNHKMVSKRDSTMIHPGFLMNPIAYNNLTVYKFGDIVIGAALYYMYINVKSGAGNITSDTAYWIPIFNAATKALTVPKYISYAGVIELTGTAETITTILSNNKHFILTFTALTAASVFTFTRTAVAGIANDQIAVTSAGDVVLTGYTNAGDKFSIIRNEQNINTEWVRNIYT